MRIILLMLLVIFCSCGKMKKTQKIDEKVEVTDQSESILEQTTVIKSFDTLLIIAADTIEGSRVIEDESVLFFENEKQSIEVTVKEGRIRARGIVKKRDVEIKAVEIINSVKSSDSRSQSAKVDRVVESEHKRGNSYWWLWVILIAGGIIYLVYRFRLI